MATIGNLHANLSLDTASFAANSNKAARLLSSNTSKMNRNLVRFERQAKRSFARVSKSMLSLRGAAVLTAGVAGIGLLVKKSLDAADSIAKTADAIGIGTDALQEYRFAADLSGISTDKFDKALKRATKSIGELRTRTSSELTTALKDFDSQLLSNIRSAGSVEQALDFVFRTMGRLEDQTQRVALATAVFGRSGIDLVNIVREDEQALDRMRQQARDLGLVLEERLLRGAEKAKDQLSILGQVISTNVTSAVLEAAPEIERLARAFSENVPGIIDWVKEFSVFMGLIDVSKVDRLREITAEIDRINEAMNTPVTGFLVEVFTVDKLKKLRDEAAAIRAELVAANPVTERFPRPTKAIAIPIGGSPIPRRKDQGAAEDASIRFEIRREAAEEAAKASQILQTRIDAETEAARRNIDTIFATVETNKERYTAELDFLAQTRQSLLETGQLTTANEAILERGAEAAKKRFDEATAMAEQAQAAMEPMIQAGERMAWTFDNALGDALRGNIKTFGDLRRHGVDALQDIINNVIRLLAVQGGANGNASVGGLISGLIVSGIGALSGGGAAAQVAGDAAGNVQFLTPFVHGGDIAAGQAALVGERGRELFIPDVAGTIIPNNELGGGGGGAQRSAPIVYQYITSPDANSFRANSRQISRLAKQQFQF